MGQLSRSPPPNIVFKALHPGKVSRKFKAWPEGLQKRSRRAPGQGQRKARSERPLWPQIGPWPLTSHPLHRAIGPGAPLTLARSAELPEPGPWACSRPFREGPRRHPEPRTFLGALVTVAMKEYFSASSISLACFSSSPTPGSGIASGIDIPRPARPAANPPPPPLCLTGARPSARRPRPRARPPSRQAPRRAAWASEGL